MFEHLSPAWRQCAEDHLVSIENHSGSKRSRATYTYILGMFFADHDPQTATRTDVLSFVNSPSRLRYARGKPVGEYCKNQRLTVLASFYKFAAGYDLPNGDPILKTRPPTQGIPFLKTGSTYRGMNQAEVEAFFSVIPDTPRGVRDRSLMVCLWWTGRRRNELLKLRVKDISETVIVDPSGVQRSGFLYRCTIKGHSRETYTGELPGPAMTAIREYWRVSGRLDTLTPESFVWTNVRHSCGHIHYDEPLCGCWLAATFKEYARAAGLDCSRVSVHSLRRSGARIRYENGSTLEELRIWLGHTSLMTTQRYIASVSSTADPASKRLEAKFAHLGMSLSR